MIIYLTRDHFGTDTTLSRLLIDYERGKGVQPFAFAVEDVDRGLDQGMTLAEIAAGKVKGRTAIPTGTYAVVLEHSGKYGVDCPTVADVPGYRYIRIHAGNSATDTEGCILPNMERDPARMIGRRSKVATDWLVAEIRREIRAGGRVQLVVQRDPEAWPTP